MAKANPQIGTCPCPFAGCKRVMAVKRFEARTDIDQHRRRAGKLYADCPDHGRIGFDGVKGTQEFLLENSDIWSDEKAAEHRLAASHSPAAASTDAAKSSNTSPTSALSGSPTGQQRSIPQKSAVKPAATPAPASGQAATKKSVFDWN